MVANTAPIFGRVPNVSWGTVTTANTAKDGTGSVVTVFTAGADGAFVSHLSLQPLGTNVATVVRVFINNGLTNGTAANNSMIFNETKLATTNSEVAAIDSLVVPLNVAIPPGYKLNVTIGTAVAAGVAVTAWGSDY